MTSVSDPTCDSAGVITYACSCGDFYEEAGEPATGHFYKLISTTPSTCKDQGARYYTCNVCGGSHVEQIPRSHNYAKSILLVDAENDPRGIGYEILQCTACLEAKFVYANHFTGHTFVDGACACGVTAIETELEVGSHDFSSAQGNNLTIDGLNAESVVDGEWIANANGSTSFVTADDNKAFADALAGVFEGNAVKKVVFSFELTYTGTATAGNGGYIMLTEGVAQDGKTQKHLSFNIGKDSGSDNIKTGDSDNPMVLIPGQTYLFEIVFDVEGGTNIVSYVDGKRQKNSSKYLLEDFSQITISNSSMFEHPTCEVKIDNMRIDCIALVLDDTNANTDYSCTHDFVASEQDEAGYFVDTCSLCQAYYYREDCEVTGGHVYGETPTAINPSDDCQVAGTETYACIICGAKEDRELPLAHTYNTAVALVSKADDPHDIGYELRACKTCDELLKVVANHESGHSFEDGVCACGAKLVETYTEAVSTLGMEYTISSDNSQPSFDVASADLAATDIDKVRLSVKFKYTGDPRESDGEKKAENFFSWRFASGADLINVRLDLSGEKAKLSYDDEITLEAGTYYTVTFDGVVSTKVVTITVTPEGGEAVVIGNKTMSEELSTSWKLYTRPKNVGYSSDASTFAMYIKDLSVGTVVAGVDETDMTADTTCAHAFTYEKVEDETYPAAEDWYKITCSGCNGYYYEKGCKGTEHVYSKTADADKHVASTCTENGKDYFLCIYCGTEKEVELELDDHKLTKFVGVVPAAAMADAYETWGCENCSYTENVAANHASGHCFENGECACGAKFVETYTEAASDLATEYRISDDNSQPSYSVASEDLAATDIDKVRLSVKFKYTGDPRESDGKNKAQNFFFWRFANGGQINVWLDLSGEKAKLDIDKIITLEAGTYYTVTFDGVVGTNVVTVTVTPEGGEPVTLGSRTVSQGVATSEQLIARPEVVGYSSDASTFAMYLKDISIGTVKSVVDTTDMMTPAN